METPSSKASPAMTATAASSPDKNAVRPASQAATSSQPSSTEPASTPKRQPTLRLCWLWDHPTPWRPSRPRRHSSLSLFFFEPAPMPRQTSPSSSLSCWQAPSKHSMLVSYLWILISPCFSIPWANAVHCNLLLTDSQLTWASPARHNRAIPLKFHLKRARHVPCRPPKDHRSRLGGPRYA